MTDCADFHFAFELYQRVCKNNFKNVFISPYSISAAMSMVLLGAEGNTAAELLKAYGVDPTNSELVHKQHQELLVQLKKASDYISVAIANKLFIEQSYQLSLKFLEESAKFYHSEAEAVDFFQDFENARHHINKWVANNTKSKIKDLLPLNSVNSDTRLIIANAIYFKGDWLNKFDLEKTCLRDFFINETQVAKVEMMTQKGLYKVGFDRTLDAWLVSLPYKSEAVSMILVVSRERFGLKVLEEKLCLENGKSLRNRIFAKEDMSKYEELILSIPKIKLEFSLNVIPVLKDIGIRDVFDANEANLSGVTGQPDLYVGGFFHKTFLEVNEKGSEAASATGAVLCINAGIPSKPNKPLKIVCNHPFLFLIVHDSTQSVLFMGRYTAPPDSVVRPCHRCSIE